MVDTIKQKIHTTEQRNEDFSHQLLSPARPYPTPTQEATPAESRRSLLPGSVEAPAFVTEELGLLALCRSREEAGRPEPPGRGHPEPTASGAEMLWGKAGDGTGEPRSVLRPRKSCSVAWGTCASAVPPPRGVPTQAWQCFKAILGQGPQSRHQLVYVFFFFLFFPSCLQHCYSRFPDGVLKTRHKKSPNSSKLLQTTQL